MKQGDLALGVNNMNLGLIPINQSGLNSGVL